VTVNSQLYAEPMVGESTRGLRADAARNVERIVKAARDVYSAQGPAGHLEEIAEQAGVNVSTLFRRFPDRQALVRAALLLDYEEYLEPRLAAALRDDDPYRGLVSAFEALMELGVAQLRLLAAARELGVRTVDASEIVLEAFSKLFTRAREAGAVRADLVPEDVTRVLVMLFSVLQTMEPGDGGWRRYVALMCDALRPGAGSELPPAAALVFPDAPAP
jgi:AcrR family transcriptional regulator